MKRILTLSLALTMLLSLAACTRRTEDAAETAVPTELPAVEETAEVTRAPEQTPDMADAALTVTDVLDAIRDYDPDDLGSSVTRYVAAAKVLTFCKDTGSTAARLEDDVEAYFSRLSEEEREAFSKRYDDVVDLAQRIAAGDVEQSEIDAALTDADLTFEPVDPVNFQHQNLTDLDALIHKHLKA